MPRLLSFAASAVVAIAFSIGIAVYSQPTLSTATQATPVGSKPERKATTNKTQIVKQPRPRKILERRQPLKQDAHIHSLKLWVQQVLYQLHPRVSIIPASVMRTLAIPHPCLHQMLYKYPKRQLTKQQRLQSRSLGMQMPGTLRRFIERHPKAYSTIYHRLYAAISFKKSRTKSLFSVAKSHLENAARLIQCFLRCRFAVMLLASKAKYLEGLVHSKPLKAHGRARFRAAVLIQAAWWHFESRRFWHPYVSTCRVRLVVLAHRLQKSSQTLSAMPHSGQVFPILLSKWMGSTETTESVAFHQTARICRHRRPSAIALSA
ncbi:hypothetical protein Ae201684P_004645 [Aphanomyces euteiches]|uniref:Uncharacterized protein n=1 Tax=Aphanomyces euteiches TaxID=100861 RepID=A0A6G0XDA4_9STRA|nr:hypothetical protein Ae201684_006081 [Aphanomyces euteiches]KAH9068948.1 hypothetical protein Ae201684P_004645 [Aphanomyces euteiches]KAH9141552.1 hypothetical protein AeRB84_014281 [Aphanomyces euteiches]